MIATTWPGPLPDLDGWPLLHVTVTTPRDQAALHRELGALGYTAEVESEGAVDVYFFVHPDGEKLP